MTAVTTEEMDRDSARGMALMTGAMLIVPGLDATAKYLGETLSPFQIAFIRYAIQSVILLVIVTVMGRSLITPLTIKALPKFVLCGMFTALAAGSLFWSLQYLPLANAIAIFFVEPLILTAFSAIFLGEKVGLHRMSAVVVGLLGALIVIRPNFALFGWAAVLPLIAAVAFAGVMTTLRSMPAGLDSLRIQTMSGAFATLFLGLVLFTGHFSGVEVLTLAPPTGFEWSLLVGVAAVATIAQAMFTLAIRYAEASLLAPFQYIEIIGATAYGYLIFGEFPDGLTWLGTAIILASGLYVIHRERVRAKARVKMRLG